MGFLQWSKHRRWGIGAAATGVAGLCLLVFGGAKLPPLPDPNGYDDLAAAGRAVQGKVPAGGDLMSASEAELRAFVHQNGEALRLARLGLGRECRVPVEYSQTYLDVGLPRSSDIRQAARLVIAAGRLAALEDRREEAITAYVDAVRLGQAASRGGLMIDAMAGLAIEAQGIHFLRQLRGDLSTAESHDLIGRLEHVDRNREPLTTIFARDYEWGCRSNGWQVKAIALLNRSAIQKMRQPAEQAAEVAYKRSAARLRLLVTDLALHAFNRENKAYPRNLSELVPRYLATVPLDPFGTSPLVYRPGPEGGLLYSVGPDGQDDGGQPLAEKSPVAGVKGDVLIDPH
jgi:hypothetical protein